MEIQNKVVLITGASAGIGLATVRQFSKAGAKVVLAARSTDKLIAVSQEITHSGGESLALSVDMRKPADIQQMVEQACQRFGRIDILINNAGQAARGTVAEIDFAHFQQIIELNIFGPVHAMQAVIPKMRQAGGGLIINISSMVTKMHLPALSAYASTKAALNMISDTAREELAADNIRVISVFPRLTSTDFSKHTLGPKPPANWNASIPSDSPEWVAQKILEAAQKEPADQFMDS